MTSFYTSVDRRGSYFRVREIRDGVRHKLKVPIEPHLYVKSKRESSTWKSIYGTPLERVNFSTPSEAKDFINNYQDVDGFEIHGMSQWLYPFLNERYDGVIKYDESRIRGINFDIEVDTVNGLPKIEYADKEIVSISARKTNGDVVAWGLVDFDAAAFKECSVEYRKFGSERSLLQDFITWWRDWDPDYVTGWNIEGFDIPYLIRRTNMVCGEQWVKYLSPWGDVNSRTIKDRYGESEIFEIAGVATLDYIALYKKFTYQKQESYSLDFIAEKEVGKTKTDYKSAGYKSLADLYTRNPQLFIEYNVTDVLRVGDIDAKMGLLSLVFSLAYTAKVEFQDTLGTVKLWDAIIHNHLAAKKIAVPQKVDGNGGVVEGAFVKEPIPGLYQWVVSFDLNSLYPHLIMQNNISPEKLVDYRRIRPTDVLENTPAFQEIQEYAKQHDYAICGNGAMYSKDGVGFLPELMEKFYAGRKTAKKEMLALEQRRENGEQGLDSEISRLNNLQMALKIALNSAYGSVGNPFFRYFDSRAAEGITQTGFVAIQWVETRINDELRRLTNQPNKDFVIAADTDSVYINLEDVVARGYKGDDKSTTAITNWLDKAANSVFQKIIDGAYADLQKYLNSPRQMMQMKRESICDKAVWVAKKRYILNVVDSEGVRYEKPKLKVSGLESKRSSTPAIVKQALESAYKQMIKQSETGLQSHVETFRDAFMSAPLFDIAIPSTANDLDQYSLTDSNIPYHMKASLIYNKLIEDKGLQSVLPKIRSGDKIRLWVLKKQNPLRTNYIAAVGELDQRILSHLYIDREAQYERLFLEPIRATIEPLGWTPTPVASLDAFFL